MAVRFKQLTPDQWPLERIRQKDVDKIYPKYDGQVMFPSSHDLTPNNLDGCLTALRCLIVVGNKMLVVSKPHLDCIKRFCKMFRPYRRRILLRFSIGACDDRILSYWELSAPSYAERKACLQYAYFSDFKTSVSVEPMLDSANIDLLVEDLSPFVTHSIWIGTMNHLGRFEKGTDMVLKQATNRIRQSQTDSIIRRIYNRYKADPLIRWKKEIKKIVGIPVPKQNGLDI
jgi:DNA repair photolyase